MWTLAQDHTGRVWLGTWGAGAAAFDGDRWWTYGTDDGLAGTLVREILEERSGCLWFATENGVSRLDGDRWSSFDSENALGDDSAWALAQDQEGHIWVGTSAGASRYDGERWRSYTEADGLARGPVKTIVVDADGRLWFGSDGYGVSVFDGEIFRTITSVECLAHDALRSLFRDRSGHIWFGTAAGLVSRFDGEVFQTLSAEDGLTGQSVRDMVQDRRGDVWMATYGGAVRFRQPVDRPPRVRLDAVVADRRYPSPHEVSIPSTVALVAFEFHGASFRTRPGGMVYRYRLMGRHGWRTTRDPRVEYTDLPRGAYTFQVEAVDRDLVRSLMPAAVALEVRVPYERIAWVSALGLALAAVGLQAARIVRRDRRLVAANAEIEAATRNKSEFLRRMSHDLRSPMNAIIGYTRLLQRKAADRLDERERRNLGNIATSAHNLLSLINDILDLSRIEAGRVEVQSRAVDLRRMVEECADTLAPNVKPGVELARELAEVGEVTTDPDRLRQVVLNLLGNAAKFTESGRITLSLAARNGAVEIGVADTGIGIPTADLPHIFDEFRQVQRQGARRWRARAWGWRSPGRRWSCWAGRSPWTARWGGDDLHGEAATPCELIRPCRAHSRTIAQTGHRDVQLNSVRRSGVTSLE